MKFRKKPVVIEAVLCNDVIDAEAADDWTSVPEWARHLRADPICGAIHIATLEGDMMAHERDWIIRGVAGEIYPCKPRIFAATYERVEER